MDSRVKPENDIVRAENSSLEFRLGNFSLGNFSLGNSSLGILEFLR